MVVVVDLAPVGGAQSSPLKRTAQCLEVRSYRFKTQSQARLSVERIAMNIQALSCTP